MQWHDHIVHLFLYARTKRNIRALMQASVKRLAELAMSASMFMRVGFGVFWRHTWFLFTNKSMTLILGSARSATVMQEC